MFLGRFITAFFNFKIKNGQVSRYRY
jgi:hypothetical protein